MSVGPRTKNNARSREAWYQADCETNDHKYHTDQLWKSKGNHNETNTKRLHLGRFDDLCSEFTVSQCPNYQTKHAAPPSASSTASFESQMLAYGGLQHVANALGKTVCGVAGVDADNSVVIIYDQTAFASLQLYEAFVANIQVVSSAYQMLIPSNDLQNAMRSFFDEHAKAFEGLAQREASPRQKDLYEYKSKRFALSLAPIDPFADAASLISAIAIASNTETPGQVTIPDSALAVALTRRMKTECHHKVTIVYPPMFGSGSSSDYASADIQVAIQKLDDIRSIAQKSVSTANQAYLRTYPLQATSATAVTKGKSATDQTANTDTKQTMFAAISADPVLTAALTDINGLYDSFVNSLLQVNASTGMIGSASVIQGIASQIAPRHAM